LTHRYEIGTSVGIRLQMSYFSLHYTSLIPRGHSYTYIGW